MSTLEIYFLLISILPIMTLVFLVLDWRESHPTIGTKILAFLTGTRDRYVEIDRYEEWRRESDQRVEASKRWMHEHPNRIPKSNMAHDFYKPCTILSAYSYGQRTPEGVIIQKNGKHIKELRKR